VLLFVLNVAWTLRRGAPAGDDPWGADTLEWSTSSPPPTYNFVHIPVVESRYPLWSRYGTPRVVTGLRTDIREVLVTNAIDAMPDHRHIIDGPTSWPFWTAVAGGAGIIMAIFTPWGVTIGALITLPPLIAWFWPAGEPIRGTAREKP
jgi:cytochrome c oxidase subunit 1